jgi:hypothetical protein
MSPPLANRLDLKTLVYLEDNDRIQVIAPSVQFERDLNAMFTLRIDGVYNAISGATPTGAPGYRTVTTTITVPAPP